jgi:hypothetical protein
MALFELKEKESEVVGIIINVVFIDLIEEMKRLFI